MQAKDSRGKLSVEYTRKPLSGWGGVVSLVELMDRLEIRGLLREVLPDGRTSPNQVDVVDMVMGLWLTAATGGKRFAHVERLRGDDALRVIAGVERFPSDSVLTRYLSMFTGAQNEALQVRLRERFHYALEDTEEILDLDATTLTRYGDQEGSEKGYHPTRRGFSSHQPMLAMLAKSKLVVHAWMRSGKASTLKGAAEFIRETVAGLPSTCRISCVRADSGFVSDEILSTLEELGLDYVIAAKMTRPLQRYAASRTEWVRLEPGLEVACGTYKAFKWRTARRVIIVRRVSGKPTPLFDIPTYEYNALFTSLDAEPGAVWNLYRGRGDCENRIKELKNDFGIVGFCLRSFTGTEVAFRLLCALHNIVTEFKRIALAGSPMTLGTIRHRIFVIGAAIGKAARCTVLRLGLTGPWSDRFEQLRSRIAAFSPTTPHPPQPADPSALTLHWTYRSPPLSPLI
jgi:hypothetical protein